MLKRFLDPKTCAQCGICCIYDDSDKWDAPGFTEEEAERNQIKERFSCRQRENGLYYLDMEKDAEGLYYCPCLTPTGCSLGEKKPFRCSLWPLYVVRTEGGPSIALTPVCPEVWKLSSEEIFEGIRDYIPQILAAVEKDPSQIEPYRPEYRMIARPDAAGEYRCIPEEG